MWLFFIIKVIKKVLSVIYFVLKINNSIDNTKNFLLKRMLKGMKNRRIISPKLLPINLQLLNQIILKISFANIPNYKRVLLKAVLLLTYYGCFRIGEVVMSAHDQHTLSIDNISLISNADEKVSLLIKLDSYKHANSPVSFIIKPLDNKLFCPVVAVLEYLKLRSFSHGSFFLMQNNVPVKREFIASSLKKYVSILGLNPKRYNTHSLRIGRATDLAVLGLPEQVIKKAGRWESDAYLKYIRFDLFTMP